MCFNWEALFLLGFAVKISIPLNALHGILRVSAANEASESKTMDHDALLSDNVVPEASLESVDDVAVETVVQGTSNLKTFQVSTLFILFLFKLVSCLSKLVDIATRRQHIITKLCDRGQDVFML